MTTLESLNKRLLRGYTLFEILLALGIIAILLGVAVPFAVEGLQKSPVQEIEDRIADVVRSVRAAALETGESRRLVLDPRGLVGSGGLPSMELPEGWSLQVRRLTENRFRKPARGEEWEFNGAGILEPVVLKISRAKESFEMTFDPLTGEVRRSDND